MTKRPLAKEKVLGKGRRLASLWRQLNTLREVAKAADQGSWRRDHSTITSSQVIDPNKNTYVNNVRSVTIALAECCSLPPGNIIYPGDPQKDFANSRHIVAAQPKTILYLIETIEALAEQITELQDPKFKNLGEEYDSEDSDLTFISINRNTINSNTKQGKTDPPIRVAKGKHGKPKYGKRIVIRGPSEVVYDAGKAILPCGARLAIKTASEVEVS